MKTISNEQKAIQIAANNRINYYEGEPGWGVNVSSSEQECYESAMQAMQWKDEQHEKEKQQWIDKVCEWIKEHNGDYISIVPNDHLTSNFYDDLRKSMKGE
jgi:hypothetical protein